MEQDVRAVSKSNVDSLPLVLTPMEVAAILGISRNKAYEVLHSDGFPSFRIGNHYRIHRDRFIQWLDKINGSKVA